MARYLLVTNDFPPKIGGIQHFLWELWSRLPADEVVVYTASHRDSASFDSSAPMPIIRSREPWLLPLPHLVRQVNRLTVRYSIDLVIIDPVFPAGLIGVHLNRPYAVIVHGAEVAIPGRLSGTRSLVKRVLENSCGIIAAGGYPGKECEQIMSGEPHDMDYTGERAFEKCKSASGCETPIYDVPPSVDVEGIVPLESVDRLKARRHFGLPADAPVVVSVSRLVPRKGMDILIGAAAELASICKGLQVLIAGEGRDRRRLTRLIGRLNAPVRLLGSLSDEDKAELYGCADVFAMLCRSRWAGLEQEGFGIVFMEAAAAGVPQVAGDSGGVRDAVVHGETGIVLEEITVSTAVAAIAALLNDSRRRRIMGEAARKRAAADFSSDFLAARLRSILKKLADS
ncbi:MAG: glycosyltransferase family 4 protein [Acidimicrobiaceae bacterium]|nr:glycosyltransferase family 4 protein [Acidimicrobiaceae bacterium]